MQILQTEQFEINSVEDIVRVRQAARAATVAAKFSLIDQTKLVTAVSELARNTLEHGGGGRATLEQVDNNKRFGLRLTFADSGKGIADIERALSDGYTTGNGLGLGLGGARRLVNELTVESKVGGGTTVTIIKWKL